MERRKFIIGMGSLAAGGAAAMGTGAFTSVSADRGIRVHTPWDSDALLGLAPEDSPNSQYVVANQDAMEIDFGGGTNQITDNGAYGVNNEAVTIVRDMFKITNQGTQDVYVWIEGCPDGIRFFHDDPSGENYKMTGTGNNQGALSDTSNLNPNDPADANDPANPGGYEAAPLLKPGDTLNDAGIIIDTHQFSNLLDGVDVTVKAVTPSEL
ncbi:hypothetical protein [Haloarchaeobius sp. DFWS5]|uniref:hypothetical protein n=1 Tax=Haloarchaeobius sp. DFWS5 TaxID=3446114 RepID=UPI003EBD8DC0